MLLVVLPHPLPHAVQEWGNGWKGWRSLQDHNMPSPPFTGRFMNPRPGTAVKCSFTDNVTSPPFVTDPWTLFIPDIQLSEMRL